MVLVTMFVVSEKRSGQKKTSSFESEEKVSMTPVNAADMHDCMAARFEKRSVSLFFTHLSCLCFRSRFARGKTRESRMWHRVPEKRIGCQGFNGSSPSAFLDDRYRKRTVNDC
jgi:hypothetical protein